MLNVLIPAAGAGKRFKEAGYNVSKPFILMNDGMTMVAHVVDNVVPRDGPARSIHLWPSDIVIDSAFEKVGEQFIVMRRVAALTDGAARTALLAKDLVDNDDPLLIANADQLIDWPTGSIDAFVSAAEKGDGGVVLFESDGNPKWSYADFDPELSRIAEIAEKRVISNYATAGIYYWKRGRDFVRSAEQMIAKDIRTNGEFYIAPSYNELIAEGATIVPYVIPTTAMHGLGTPEDLEAYLASR